MPTSPSPSMPPSSDTGSILERHGPAGFGLPNRDPAWAPVEATAGTIDDAVLDLLPRRGAESTKFTSGEVVLVGGSRGLTGAVCLAAEAAVRAGAGYATVVVPADLEAIFEVKLTEVMSRGYSGAAGGSTSADADAIIDAAARASAVVLGSGLARDEGSLELARRAGARDRGAARHRRGWPQRVRRQDRGACNALRAHGAHAARRRARPPARHRLGCGRLGSARAVRARPPSARGCVVVLKGDDTLVAEAGPPGGQRPRESGPRDGGHRRCPRRDGWRLCWQGALIHSSPRPAPCGPARAPAWRLRGGSAQPSR